MDRRDRHVGDLPWGWWLRAHDNALVDEEGRKWHSVRDAFWQGELGFPANQAAAEQHELLLRVLTSIDARWRAADERPQDIFAGDLLFWRFQLWLASIGMLKLPQHAPGLEAPLSLEGRSVKLMLQATRDPAWEALPMADIVAAVAAANRGPADDAREEALRRFEGSVGFRRHVFARERVNRTFLITLTGIATDARMPTRRVTWSQPFTDPRARDDLFGWLAERIERWDDWGQIAYRSGGEALTRHILALVVRGRA